MPNIAFFIKLSFCSWVVFESVIKICQPQLWIATKNQPEDKEVLRDKYQICPSNINYCTDLGKRKSKNTDVVDSKMLPALMIPAILFLLITISIAASRGSISKTGKRTTDGKKIVIRRESKSMKRSKIHSIGYIWLLTIFAFGSAARFTSDKSEKKINKTDCWNYGKNKSEFAAPVFSFDEGNLSFDGCGKWARKNDSADKAPWLVRIGARSVCQGLILSQQTIISSMLYEPNCRREHEAFTEGKETKIFSGKCVGDRYGENCYRGNGLLGQKLLEVKQVKMEIGSYYLNNYVYVWKVERLRFTPSLQPVCLWNRDNRNDEEENYFILDIWRNIFKSSNIWPEEHCYKERIRKSECDLYGNSICTPKNKPEEEYLLINLEGRFYLRGLQVKRAQDFSIWLDLLPFMRQIVSASVDLALNASNLWIEREKLNP
ncbi:uncharacterized protein LOC132204003 [Neocloeon triangulifer]|uniref:uncharacterized protein LOC132204003 n=1 Tax=Neocloeon triangulifer TaxID=2078957 RepID=UPI00286EE0E4|nr:uncharacterized protein LOC132204003 [Neocloeon triangulifer]